MENKLMHEQLTIYAGTPIIARHYDYDRFTFPWHVHNEFEIIYVKESTGERFVADNMETFYPHDLTFVGHGVPHYMKSAPEYETNNHSLRVKGVIIQFEEHFMSHSISNYADLAHIKKLLDESARGIHFPYPENKETMDQRMEKILSFLANHYKENIDLNEISSIVAMNSSSFCRYFKERSGKTFMEYLLDLRIGHACKLLIENKIDITQISIECGFNTITHFNRIFKRNTGLTPSEYKKQFLK